MEISGEQLTEFEKYAADALVRQSTAQDLMDRSIQESNLHAAAVASFRYAIASLDLVELGDTSQRKNFYQHLSYAVILAEADVLFDTRTTLEIAEDLPEVASQPVTFDIPRILQEASSHNQSDNLCFNLSGTHLERHWSSSEQYAEGKARVIKAVEEAETFVQIADVTDSHDKNAAMHNAVYEICYFLDSMDQHYKVHNARLSLLNLAANIASHIDLDGDEEETILAFYTYAYLFNNAISTDGKTLAIVRQSTSAFERISEQIEANNKLTGETEESAELLQICNGYTKLSRAAQRELLRQYLTLPLRNTLACMNAYAPWGSSPAPHDVYAHARVTEMTQLIAQDTNDSVLEAAPSPLLPR